MPVYRDLLTTNVHRETAEINVALQYIHGIPAVTTTAENTLRYPNKKETAFARRDLNNILFQ